MEDQQLETLLGTLETLRKMADGLVRSQGRLDALTLLSPRQEVTGVIDEHHAYQTHALSMISMLGLGISALADGDPERCDMIAEQIERLA